MILRPPPPAVPSRASRPPSSLLSFLACAATGVGAGLLNGLLGAAGGILLVLLLPILPNPFSRSRASLWDGTPPSRDVLAASLCIMLPVSAVSGCFYLLGGIRPAPAILALLILPALLGGWLGAILSGRIPDTALRRIFAILVAVAGARMLL